MTAQLAPVSEPQATSLPGDGTTAPNPQQLESSPTIEKLQRDLASATSAIAQLEKAKAAAEAAQAEAAKSKRDAEAARRESEQARATEKAKLDKKIAQLEAASAVAYPKANRWENALYGSVGGLLIVLLGSAMGFLWKQHNARKSATATATEPTIEHWERSPAGHEGEPFVASPAIAIAEDAFGRELAQQVAALNATETETETTSGPQADATATLDAPKDAVVAALTAIDRVSNCVNELTLACHTHAPPVAATAEEYRGDSAAVSAPPPEPIARVSCPA
jgi:cell division protein FtsL